MSPSPEDTSPLPTSPVYAAASLVGSVSRRSVIAPKDRATLALLHMRLIDHRTSAVASRASISRWTRSPRSGTGPAPVGGWAGSTFVKMVELEGLEPSTFWLPARRSPS
jgi:hypothetical protein